MAGKEPFALGLIAGVAQENGQHGQAQALRLPGQKIVQGSQDFSGLFQERTSSLRGDGHRYAQRSAKVHQRAARDRGEIRSGSHPDYGGHGRTVPARQLRGCLALARAQETCTHIQLLDRSTGNSAACQLSQPSFQEKYILA
jgi:hypothetical protein